MSNLLHSAPDSVAASADTRGQFSAAALMPDENTIKFPMPDQGWVLTQFPRLVHRPDVDGLRALAVVPVVLYHFDLGCPGGFAGVDIFFMISGFLITSIILGKLDTQSFSLGDFWMRRCRRLFPAMAVVLTVTLGAADFILLSDQYQSLLQQTRATLLIGANVHFYMSNNYFSDEGELPLLHCWSLAVEEHFYLFCPASLYLVWRLQRKWALHAIVIIMVGSLFFSIVATPTLPNFSFYLLPARAWEMALGGVLAFDNGIFRQPVVATVAGWAGIGMMVASYFVFDKTTPWPGYAAGLPCFGAMLLIASQRVCSNSAGKVLSIPPMIFIGKISYSWYLWHWPIFVLMTQQSTHGQLSIVERILGLCFSVMLSILSYYAVESTTRSVEKVSNRVFYSGVAVVWTGLLLFAIISDVENVGGITIEAGSFSSRLSAPRGGGRTRNATEVCANTSIGSNLSEHIQCACSTSKPNKQQCGTLTTRTDTKCESFLSEAQVDALHTVKPSDMSLGKIMNTLTWDQSNPRLYGLPGAVDDNDPPYVSPIDATWPTTTKATDYPAVVVIGSSHCGMYMPLFEKLAQKHKIKVGYLCNNGNTGKFHVLLDGQYGRIEDKVRMHWLAKWRPHVVAWMDFWAGDTNSGAQDPWWYDPLPGTSGSYQQSYLSFEDELKLLRTWARNVVVVGDVPTLPIKKQASGTIFKNYVYRRHKETGNLDFMLTLKEDPRYRARRLMVESAIRKATLKVPCTRFVEAAPYFELADTQELQLINPFTGTSAYKDFGHLTPDGADMVAQLFAAYVFEKTICCHAAEPSISSPTRVASSTPPPPPPPPSYEKRTPNGHCTNLGGETANVGLWDNVLGSFCHSNGGDCLPYTYGTSLAKCQRICDANRGCSGIDHAGTESSGYLGGPQCYLTLDGCPSGFTDQTNWAHYTKTAASTGAVDCVWGGCDAQCGRSKATVEASGGSCAAAPACAPGDGACPADNGGCTWTSHANKYSGEYAGGHSTRYSLGNAKTKCIELGAVCAAVTCEATGATACTVRASSTLQDSTSETSYTKVCGGGGGAAGTVIRWLPLGDSITCGSGTGVLPFRNNGCREDASAYRIAIAQALVQWGIKVTTVGSKTNGPDSVPSSWTSHEGHPGWRIDQLEAIAPQWTALNPNVVTVLLGANDCLMSTSVTDVVARMKKLLQTTAQALPNAKVFVASMLPVPSDAHGLRRACYEGLNNALPGLLKDVDNGKGNFVYVPLAENTRAITVSTSTKTATRGITWLPWPASQPVTGDSSAAYTAGDGVHPNPAGLLRIAAIFTEVMMRKLCPVHKNGHVC